MDFYEVLEQELVLLQRHGRVSYRALKRQFGLADEALDDLKEELCYAHPVVDNKGKGLIWTGEATSQSEPEKSSKPAQTSDQPTTEPGRATRSAVLTRGDSRNHYPVSCRTRTQRHTMIVPDAHILLMLVTQ